MNQRIEDLKGRFDEAIYQTKNLMNIFIEIKDLKRNLTDEDFKNIKNHEEFQKSLEIFDSLFKK